MRFEEDGDIRSFLPSRFKYSTKEYTISDYYDLLDTADRSAVEAAIQQVTESLTKHSLPATDILPRCQYYRLDETVPDGPDKGHSGSLYRSVLFYFPDEHFYVAGTNMTTCHIQGTNGLLQGYDVTSGKLFTKHYTSPLKDEYHCWLYGTDVTVNSDTPAQRLQEFYRQLTGALPRTIGDTGTSADIYPPQCISSWRPNVTPDDWGGERDMVWHQQPNSGEQEQLTQCNIQRGRLRHIKEQLAASVRQLHRFSKEMSDK